MRRGAGYKAAALVLAVVVAAAACGSSSSKSSAGAKASSSSTTTGAASASSGPDIVVGGLYALHSFPGIDTGFKARITRFNNQGGVSGRKIKFLGVQDDGEDTSKDLTLLQSLVLNNHVFAAVPVATDVLSAASTDFLAQNHTPLLGYAVTSPWCNNPWAFGVTGCQQNPHVQSNAAANEIIKAFGRPASEIRLAMEGLNIQAAQSVGKTLAKVWQTTGAQVVFNEGQIPLAQSVDFTPFVQSILASKPNVVFEVTDAATAIALAGALKAGGYNGLVYNGSTYLPTQLASQPNVAAALDGVYTVNLTPTQVDGTPAVKQEQDDLQAIGASPDIQIGTGVGYWTAEMFIQMLQATAAKGPLTPDAFQQTVNAGLTIQPPLPGGNGPLKFPEYLNEPQPCNSLIQAKGNHYVSKIPFSCYQNVQVP